MANEFISEIILSFDIDSYLPIVQRDLDLGDPLPPRAGNLVKVVTGMRRSGKSYRLFQEMERLLALGIPKERICYFNFEDTRLGSITPETGDTVLEAFFFLYPAASQEGAYLFFDELQEMDRWGAWLRRVVDTTKATIYVTGSSSKMLSEEISTEFRGRAVDFELLPYSFREYVSVEAPHIDTNAVAFSSQDRRVLQSLFRDYITLGGFPATLALPRVQAVELLQTYVQRVVARDVVERHGISRPRIASLFAQRTLGTNAKALSIRKIQGDLKSIGMPTSRALLGDLLSYLEQAFLVFPVREFSYALAESTRNMPKIYAIDPGLAMANARANSNEEGQRLEDAVYLELRRRNTGMRKEGISSLITREHGYEVDFVVGDALYKEVFELYQVSVDVQEQQTQERETRALFEAMQETGAQQGTLIVLDGQSAVYEREGRVIRQIPAWSWFLENPSQQEA